MDRVYPCGVWIVPPQRLWTETILKFGVSTMSELATAIPGRPPAAGLLEKKMKKSHALVSGAVVLIALVVGIGFIGLHISQDFDGVTLGSAWPYVLLIVALFIALGFEFVNGFHDTANAVATVIYTHSLPPHVAVLWSGFFNFAGVLVSIGAMVGVGVANALMPGRDDPSGVDWSQVTKIGESLLLSPLVGFAAAGLLLWALGLVLKN